MSGFPIYYLWSTVSVITETLPERSLHRERDFAALHYDVLRLSAEIDMYIANSNESNLNSLFTAADLLAIRSGDTKGLYSTDDTAGISKVQEDIDRVVAILDDVRARNVALDADILENISDRLGKDSLLSRRISDQVFQKSMEQVTAQRGQIESFRESMVVLLCVVAALAISLLALLFNQRRTIKALHKQDAELGETMRQMQRADQIKNEFVARMSHDLRTPLNAIIGFSSMIKNGITGPAGAVAYQGYAGNILNASEHLLRLINDILDISRIEANKLELHADQVSVQNLFDYLSRTLSGIIHSKGLHLTISPVSPDVVFEGDEQRL
ncbi:MAG: hypothetical protein O2944_01620, partial [Proteobacteria bacterium]|nr:hypothetical protein [Pseudomonadota bacterium]